MARNNSRFKRAYNEALEICRVIGVGRELPSEPVLAARLDTSRTTVRAVLTRLKSAELVDWRGRRKIVLRSPGRWDRFDETELSTMSERLEGQFFEWMLRSDVPPDTPLNVSALARRFAVSPSGMTDVLRTVAQFGLIERHGTRGWITRGFNRDYAGELSDFRLVLELDAVRKLCALPDVHPIWRQLDEMEAGHRALLAEIDTRFHDFSKLDERFHATINEVASNRFARSFQSVISLVFNYHYQWNKKDEKPRNETAIHEHLDYIAALRSRDAANAQAAAIRHLTTARETLLRSIGAER